jgi:hypothetical protein
MHEIEHKPQPTKGTVITIDGSKRRINLPHAHLRKVRIVVLG